MENTETKEIRKDTLKTIMDNVKIAGETLDNMYVNTSDIGDLKDNINNIRDLLTCNYQTDMQLLKELKFKLALYLKQNWDIFARKTLSVKDNLLNGVAYFLSDKDGGWGAVNSLPHEAHLAIYHKISEIAGLGATSPLKEVWCPTCLNEGITEGACYECEREYREHFTQILSVSQAEPYYYVEKERGY